MPSKKKKYNARFPAGRIKKIMQSDEEIGKVAQAVPVIISRTLELFVESLLTKTLKITNSRNAKTLSTSHMKQCIMSEQRFDFLRELVKNIPDISVAEEAANYNDDDGQSSTEDNYPDSDTPYDLSMASTSLQANRSSTSINGSHNRSSKNHNLNGSHNSGGSSYPGLDLSAQFEPADIRNHLRQTVTSPLVINQTNAKVIHHSDHVKPIKLTLMRSESTPTHSGMPQQQQNWTIQQHQHGQNRQRLKNRGPASSCRDAVPSKQQKFENPPQMPTPIATSTVTTAQPPQTAIPAPVVSFDFCNKPVVKIDYSHLSLSTSQSDGGPHSAPALSSSSSGSSSSFNFSPAPVINIDLTNLVTSVPQLPKSIITTTPQLPPSPNPAIATVNFDGIPMPAATKATASASVSATASSPSSLHPATNSSSAAALLSPAIATITFDGIPSPLKPLAITSITSPTSSTITTPTQSKPSNPKATKMAMPFHISNTVPTKNTTTIALSKNSFCELDEDYDNI